MRNFRNLKIWQKGLEIAKQSFELSKSIPKEEQYGLIRQITKSAVSIPSNIAESCGRRGERETEQFLRIALGSAYELETQILIADTLMNNSSTNFIEYISIIQEEQRMIAAYINGKPK
jgi:four helix bundle protein